MANVSKFTTCISLNNQPCMARPALIDLIPDEYNQGLPYYPIIVNLGRWNRSCKTFDDLSDRICTPNKRENVNLNVFNTMTRINEPKTLTKHTSCKYKYKVDGRICNSNPKRNNDKCQCECKNLRKRMQKKLY